MNDLNKFKDFTLTEIQQERKRLHTKIKAIRALSFVFDVSIIMMAILFTFEINLFLNLHPFLIPSVSSVILHSFITYQNDKSILLDSVYQRWIIIISIPIRVEKTGVMGIYIIKCLIYQNRLWHCFRFEFGVDVV